MSSRCTIIYYTHNDLKPSIFSACFNQLIKAAKDHQLIIVSSRPISGAPGDATQILWSYKEPGLRDCYEKIILGLAHAEHQMVYLVEHDVLYPCGYFDQAPAPDQSVFWFNMHVFRLNWRGFFLWGSQLTSNCVARVDLLRKCYDERMGWLMAGERIVWDEPGRMGEVCPMANYGTIKPTIDIRHGTNLTGMREADGEYLDEITGWAPAAEWVARFGLSAADAGPEAAPAENEPDAENES